MPRRPRVAMGGLVYHVLNRGVGRMTLFEDDADYAAFERVMCEALERVDVRLLTYCLMPNHWHLLLWPRRGRDGDLSEFMRWLTVTHTQRWHAHRRSSGTGPVYQGRFKSFPVQDDEHLLTVSRYVERNAVRAGLADRAAAWPWGGASARRNDADPLGDPRPPLSDGPITRPRQWSRCVDRPLSDMELESLRRSVRRGAPYGAEPWIARTAAKLGLESSLTPRGRPRKHPRPEEQAAP